MDLTTEVFPYVGPQTSHYYNKFFHPNLCHVCKKARIEDEFITCHRCFLISYCSEDHRKLHLPQHRDFCAAAEKYLQRNPKRFTDCLTHLEWSYRQTVFLLSVQMTLLRKLEMYEADMFVLARSCLVCHQQTELYTCELCYSADYCADHREELENEHNSLCDKLILWLNLELSNLQYGSTIPFSMEFVQLSDNNRFFYNVETFITRYIKGQTVDATNESTTWFIQDYIYSDYVSGPLTLYYAMHRANLLRFRKTGSTCVIHVIAANTVERDGLAAWEILLHLVPNIQILIIVMIGPKSSFEHSAHDICSRCKNLKKRFFYECCPIIYHKYLSVGVYRQPNIIVGLQPLLRLMPSWSNSIRAMQTRNCPLLLTEKTQCEIQENIKSIQQVLGSAVKPVLAEVNQFNSLKPVKSCEGLSNRNRYILVYNKLNNLEKQCKSR